MADGGPRVRESIRNYLDQVTSLTEVTAAKAQAAARGLWSSGGATAEQVRATAEEVLRQNRENREAVGAIVRGELERTLSRLGLASAEEAAGTELRLARLESDVQRLQAELSALRAAAAVTPPVRRPTRTSTRAGGAGAGAAGEVTQGAAGSAESVPARAPRSPGSRAASGKAAKGAPAAGSATDQP